MSQHMSSVAAPEDGGSECLRRRRRRLVTVVFLTGAALILAACGVRAWWLGTTLLSLDGHVRGIQTLAAARQAGPDAIIPAREHIIGIRDGLTALRAELGPCMSFGRHLGWMPGMGGDLEAAPDLFEMALSVADAGALLTEDLKTLLEANRSPGGTEASPGGLIGPGMAWLVSARPDLMAARERLAAAEDARRRVDTQRLSVRVADMVTRFDRYAPLMGMAVDGALVASDAVMGSDPVTYLILAQNDDELRPTGGFISAAGLVTLDQGRITRLKFDDSYRVDDLRKPYPEPPRPLRDYMLADLWLFRDANWSPDFPTTARKAAEMYEYGQGVRVDGVIAVDQVALRYLLEGLGPVAVESTGETITAYNVISAIRTHWAPAPGESLTGGWWRKRKSFLGELAAAVRRKLESQPGSINLVDLARTAKRALDEKHILMYPLAQGCVSSAGGPEGDCRRRQLEMAAFLERSNWDGAIRQTDGDYLMVVDANVGFNKANVLVTKQIDYEVVLQAGGSATAQASVTYHHAGTRQVERCQPEIRYDPIYARMTERCLWDYVRLYVPEGAILEEGPSVVVPDEEMLSPLAETGDYRPLAETGDYRPLAETGDYRGRPTTGAADVGPTELNRTPFGLLFVLAPGQTIKLNYAYRLPTGTIRRQVWSGEWRYDLLVQKQPGTGAAPVQVTLVLPEGAVLTASQPEANDISGREIRYHFDLTLDRGLSLRYYLAANQ
jgi:hypothetical protein